MLEAKVDKLKELRTKRFELNHQNHHLSSQNLLLKQSMRQKALTNIQKKAYGVKKDKQEDILSKVVLSHIPPAKFRPIISMKDLDYQMKKNEAMIARNDHQKKKLEEVHYKEYMKEIKLKSKNCWRHNSLVKLKLQPIQLWPREQTDSEPQIQTARPIVSNNHPKPKIQNSDF